MPADRLTHPREGHSEKLCALNDFEYRVWNTYRWAADDFGVMRMSAVAIQDANERFEREPAATIDAALARFVRVELLLKFEHQGRSYVCSYDWQNRQTVRYPRETIQPPPSPEVLELCSLETRRLFRSCHPALRCGNKKFQKVVKNSAPRARGRAQNANANANGITLTASSEGGCGGKPKPVDHGAVYADERLRIPDWLDRDLARMHPTYDRMGFYQRLSDRLGDEPQDQSDSRVFAAWVKQEFCREAKIPPPEVQAQKALSVRRLDPVALSRNRLQTLAQQWFAEHRCVHEPACESRGHCLDRLMAEFKSGERQAS